MRQNLGEGLLANAPENLHSALGKPNECSQDTHIAKWPLAPSHHSATKDLRAQTTKYNRNTKEADGEFKNKSLLVQLQKDIKQD